MKQCIFIISICFFVNQSIDNFNSQTLNQLTPSVNQDVKNNSFWMSITHFIHQWIRMLVIQSVKRCSRHQLPSQQQVATKQSKAVMQRPSQSSTHNYPLNCLPMACTLNRSLLPITTSTISKGYCTFSGSDVDVDVDGFRVRAQGWTDGWNQNEPSQKSTAMGH